MNTIDRRVRRLEALQAPKVGPRLIVVGAPCGIADGAVNILLDREGVERDTSDLVVIINRFRSVKGSARPTLISITETASSR